jgi:SAM-dependent methyltransferase
MSRTSVPPPPKELLFMGDTEETYLQMGLWLLRLADGRWKSSGSVVDVGCGYGRLAYALLHEGFAGEYLGLDVLKPQISWLQEHFTPNAPKYRFAQLDIRNDRYNPSGTEDAASLKIEATEPGLILCLSVFTHMLEGDVLTYLREFSRIMGPHSVAYVTFFLLNDEQRLLEKEGKSRFPIEKQLNDHCAIHDSASPLHVVAYEENWLTHQIALLGFDMDIVYGRWCGRQNAEPGQDVLFLRKVDARALNRWN